MLNSLPRPYRVIIRSFTILSLAISVCRPYVYYRDFASEVKTFELEKNKNFSLLERVSKPIYQYIKDGDFFLQNGLNKKNISKIDINFLKCVTSIGDKVSNVFYQQGINTRHYQTIFDNDLININIIQKLFCKTITSNSSKVSSKNINVYDYINHLLKIPNKTQRWNWINILLKKTIKNSLISNIYKTKCIDSEINSVIKKLQWKLNSYYFTKKNNEFSLFNSKFMIYNYQYKFNSLKETNYLYFISNKNYYKFRKSRKFYGDLNNSNTELYQGFSRFPTEKQFRVSSNFNPRRLNPITRRISPHCGVDFAMPQGTPVLAVGDGEVIMAKHSVAAGYYVVIQHSQTYTTRYMHLYKLLVKTGQKVKWGDRIALSGNTGRSTGPHLHYEFWVNKQAVNPLTVKLPHIGGGKINKNRCEYLT